MRTMRLATATLLLCTASGGVMARPSRDADPAAAAEWRRRGLALGYNLDHAEAIAAFHRAIEADPGSPTG
ncbi:MAG TPA: tetratricopeptide repeat protein, partial [Vicinamibacterales bacterium]|nr:tetratricopeptide repeat protein [Vicinamibacterales bacterium]